MSNPTKKAVIIIDADLPLGLIANTAAVLALTLGKRIEDLLGPDVNDASGSLHVGITTIPIPILKGSAEKLIVLRENATTDERLLVVDFSDAAQTTTTYDAYTQKLSTATTSDLTYLGIAIYGDSKLVNKLTGSMPLLR